MKVSEGFNRDLIERLDRLHLRFSRQVGGISGGVCRSNEKGSSNEFSDFRSYNDGDSLRYVDWNSYARLGKLFIKLYMEEKRTEVGILTDNSVSMDFYGKAYTQGIVAASLAYTVVAGGDRAKLYSGEKSFSYSAKGELNRMLDFLDSTEYKGGFDPFDCVKKLSLNSRGRFVVISDLMYPPQKLEETVKYLVYKKQEPTVIMLTAKEENTPELSGELTLNDAETDAKVSLEMTEDILSAYREALKQHKSKIYDICRRYGAELIDIRAEENISSVLNKIFSY